MSSPQLDEEPRSREQVALQLAVAALLRLRLWNRNAEEYDAHRPNQPRDPSRARNHAALAQQTLDRIESIVPGSTERGVGNP